MSLDKFDGGGGSGKSRTGGVSDGRPTVKRREFYEEAVERKRNEGHAALTKEYCRAQHEYQLFRRQSRTDHLFWNARLFLSIDFLSDHFRPAFVRFF